MISVEDARNIVKEHVTSFGTEEVDLQQSIGRILAEEVKADRDFPPYERVTMDGIALNFDAYKNGIREFLVEDTCLAGEPQKTLLEHDNCVEIMTGAVLARNCDVVIRYEDIEFVEKDGQRFAKVLDDKIFEWKNVHRQGSDSLAGDSLIDKGTRIDSALISILATVGRDRVNVMSLPKVAVISTGDELVDVNENPAPHQIRKSNTITIQAELNQLGITNECFHLVDDKEIIISSLRQVLSDFDVMILSGGVSKGKVDHVPEALEEIGVKKLFHRVAQRPGKPFWFGTYQDTKPVFAFPGNPISTFTCFKVYFMDWLNANLGSINPPLMAELTQDFSFKPDLGYFLQVKSEDSTEAKLEVKPQVGNGSGDIANLAKSDGIIFLPVGQESYKKGSTYEYFAF